MHIFSIILRLSNQTLNQTNWNVLIDVVDGQGKKIYRDTQNH